jgi:hypothetical protein
VIRPNWIVHVLLLLIALFLGMIAIRPYLDPEQTALAFTGNFDQSSMGGTATQSWVGYGLNHSSSGTVREPLRHPCPSVALFRSTSLPLTKSSAFIASVTPLSTATAVKPISCTRNSKARFLSARSSWVPCTVEQKTNFPSASPSVIPATVASPDMASKVDLPTPAEPILTFRRSSRPCIGAAGGGK